MRLWTWAVIIADVITVAVVWQVAATSGPRYDSEGLPTVPVGVAYVTHVPAYRLVYPGARFVAVYNNGELHYDGFDTHQVIPATSKVSFQAPATRRQIAAWYTVWLIHHGWTRCARCNDRMPIPDTIDIYFTHGRRRFFSLQIGQEHAIVDNGRTGTWVAVSTQDSVQPYAPASSSQQGRHRCACGHELSSRD